MTATPHEPASTEPTSSSELRIALRWTDFDPAGHVTDTAYPIFLSEGRGMYIAHRLGPFTEWPCVLRAMSIDFRREIRFPAGSVVVRTRVARIGRSSIHFEQEILRSGQLVACATATNVAFDVAERAARGISAEDRARLLSPAPR